MAKHTEGNPDRKKLKARIEFVDIEDQTTAPQLAIALIDPKGKREEVKLSEKQEFEIDEALISKGYSLEICGAAGGKARRFSLDVFVSQIRRDGLYRIPKGTWVDWIWHFTCVSGRVEVCRWIFPHFPLDQLVARVRDGLIDNVIEVARDTLPELVARRDPVRLLPIACDPVCNGKVEVFLRTCCCPVITPIDPPVIIDDLCKIIGCPPIPWPPEPGPIGPWPGPDPLPGPRPDPFDTLNQATIRALQRSRTALGASSAEAVLSAADHLANLLALPAVEARVRYIERFPELRLRLCTCSTQKVAEVALQADGSFDACFFTPLVRIGCTLSVQYRVSQLQESGWVVIYDGPAKGESFALDEAAELRASWKAEACDETEYDPGVEPYVLLERIGSTWADNLIRSTDQDGETSFAGPLAVKDGLVNEAPAGPLDPDDGPYDQPWAKTLSLRYQLHPALENAPVGATYYRTRVVQIDDNGNPTGTGFTLTGDLSWRKYYEKPDGTPGVRWVALHNPVINSLEGLYTIPYPDLVWPWLGGQFHAAVDTTALSNGRYLFVVDVFDAGGNRLVPNSSVDAPAAGDVAKPFQFLRLEGPVSGPVSDTSPVPRNALANLFLVNNLACAGDIEALKLAAAPPANENCQFLTGAADDTIEVQYTANHGTGYQWYHHVSVKKGLNGPTTFLDLTPTPDYTTKKSANVVNGFSQPITFGTLLGTEPKCSFAARIRCYARHTNGSGRIDEYDGHETVSFALEIAP